MKINKLPTNLPKSRVCTCGKQNFKNRTNCYKCSADKSENAAECMIAPRKKPEGGGIKGWICVCKLQNFADRTNCFKCGAERAENASSNLEDQRDTT